MGDRGTDNECSQFGYFILFEFQEGFGFDVGYSVLTFSEV
jgi:hypothetical protein